MTTPPSTGSVAAAKHRWSVVIPVFDSEEVVGSTVDRVVEVFAGAGLELELILVNDGSRDDSWEVISAKAREHEPVIALDLLRNYGQHHANMAGLRAATGDYVITMDDDLQNPPEEALKLLEAAVAGGHDLVFGQFERKRAARHRRLGSVLVAVLNRRIFGQPDDLVVSNFRVLRRDVVDRICAARAAYPYITGQALLYSRHRANVLVRHDARPVGASTYNLARMLRLVLTILFSYSSFPLRFLALVGFGVAVGSMLLGGFYLVLGVTGQTDVPGWTTVVVLLAVFNGFTIALLSMLGEYVVRTLTTVSVAEDFHVITRVGG